MDGSEKSGSLVNSEGQGSLQGGVFVADSDSILKSGCVDGIRVFQNSMAEELKVLKLPFSFIAFHEDDFLNLYNFHPFFYNNSHQNFIFYWLYKRNQKRT